MDREDELVVTFEGGVFRPDSTPAIPEHARLRIAIRGTLPTPESEQRGRERLRAIRESGAIKLNGWRPTRDELHERS